LRTFEIPEIFRFNSSNEPFLILDSADPVRTIAFASKTSLNYLGRYIIIVINKLQIKNKQKNMLEKFLIEPSIKKNCLKKKAKFELFFFSSILNYLSNRCGTPAKNFICLGSCTMIHSDGTFKTAPRYFSQAYTIHGWSSSTGE
jgi:hypothetical protein